MFGARERHEAFVRNAIMQAVTGLAEEDIMELLEREASAVSYTKAETRGQKLAQETGPQEVSDMKRDLSAAVSCSHECMEGCTNRGPMRKPAVPYTTDAAAYRAIEGLTSLVTELRDENKQLRQYIMELEVRLREVPTAGPRRVSPCFKDSVESTH